MNFVHFGPKTLKEFMSSLKNVFVNETGSQGLFGSFNLIYYEILFDIYCF